MRYLIPAALVLGGTLAFARPAPFPTHAGASSSANGLYFKPGKGLVAESGDGEFQLSVGARIQLRYTNANPNDGETLHQLSVRRMRLNMAGHLFGEDNTFKIQYAMSPEDLGQGEDGVSDAPMLDAIVAFEQIDDLNVQLGQYKVPYSRERIASSGALTFVDRSLADTEFTLDRDIGGAFTSDDLFGADLLSYYAGVFTGQGRNGSALAEATPMFLLRASVRPFGSFKEYDTPDLDRVSSPKLAIGAGFVHHPDAKGSRGNRGYNPASEGATFNHVTGDAAFRWSGWGVTGGFYWRDGEDAADGTNTNGTGFFVESGLVFPRHPFDMGVRYGQVKGTDDQSSVTDQQELGVALNHYLADHFLKFTLDYLHYWGEPGFGKGDDQVRLQLQVSL